MKFPSNRFVALECVTGVAMVLAVAVFGESVRLFNQYPAAHGATPFWTPVEKIGPTIAGSWVLCAALLAIVAAGVTALAARQDSEARAIARRRATKHLCAGEVRAFWDRCNQLELHAKLKDHIVWLMREKDTDTQLNAFRRNWERLVCSISS